MTDQTEITQFKAILKETQCGDTAKIKQAEVQLKQYKDSNFIGFVHNLVTIVIEVPPQNAAIADDNEQVRKLAAILFKNTMHQGIFGNKDPAFKESAWFKLDSETRQTIKGWFLETLGGDNQHQFTMPFLKDLCQCISAIATIEIPTGEWGNYVSVMSQQAMQNDNKLFKMAGILNLGNIQDGLRASDFSEEDIQTMWGAILENIDGTNLELSKIVAISIENLAPTSVNHFGDEQKRNMIMTAIFELLKIQDDDVRSKTLQALLTIIGDNYQYMQQYLEHFYQMTESFINDDDASIAQTSVEIWSTLFDEEIALRDRSALDKNAHFVSLIKNFEWKKVSKVFLQGLQKTDFGDDIQTAGDDQNQSVSLACMTALRLLAQIVKDDILEQIFEYFTMLLQHEKQMQSQGQPDQSDLWLLRYVGMLALYACVEGPSPQAIVQAFTPHAEWVFNNSQGPTILRSRVAQFFAKVSENCPELLVESNQQITMAFIQWYCSCMNDEQVAHVVYSASLSMSKLFIKLHSCIPQQKNFKLNSYFVEVIQCTMQRSLNRSLPESFLPPVIDSLNDMVQHCDKDGLNMQLHALCQSVVQAFEESILNQNNPGGYTGAEQDALINNLGGQLQILIVHCGDRLQQDEELISKILNILNNVCTGSTNWRGGALLIINGLVNMMPVYKIKNISDTIMELVEQTITDRDMQFDPLSQRLATGILQDLATNMEEEFLSYLERGMALGYTVLEQNHFNTEVKTIAIICLGDLCLQSEKAFYPHLNKTMELLVSAGQMSLQVDQVNDPDERSMLYQLRKALIEAFLGIINGIKTPLEDDMGPDVEAAVINHVQAMFFYVDSLMQVEKFDYDQDHIELAKQILDLYADIILTASQNRAAPASNGTNALQQFRKNIKESNLHESISQKLANFVPQISNYDGGSDSIERFQQAAATVKHHLLV